MKNNILFLATIALMFCNCKSPSYLPSLESIATNEFGSYIEISQESELNIDGELIAIENNNIVVLSTVSRRCVIVPISKVRHFTLKYAKSKKYGWTIPLFIVLPFMHGAFSIFTIPIHLITTISVTAAGEKAIKYNHKNMTFDELRLFARFPQGLPTNIELANIKGKLKYN